MAFQGPEGPGVVALPAQPGRGGTSHTPEGVGYYLDQATRARSVGARSAAAAMYRAALEQVLFDQGYRVRMLGNKIAELERDRKEGRGPGWVRHIDPGVLSLLKRIGDGAVHPGEGDVAGQQALDEDLLRVAEDLLGGLLEEVYETPARQAEAQRRLSAAAEQLGG